jgi:peptide/nickel transport system permease protein
MTIAASNPVRVAAPRPSGAFTRLRQILFGRPETAFATVVIGLFIIVAAVAPLIAPYDPLTQSIMNINKMPSADHWLGTDLYGRDVLSRLLYGSRNSLLFGFISPVLAAFFGTLLGVIAGYFGGIADRVISRVVDLLLAFPELLLAILIAAALGGGFWNIITVITVAFVPGFARVARAQTMAVKHEPFVEAAVSMGVRAPVIIARHIVPNIMAPIVALMTLWVASAIRIEASLSFLGLGTQPPNPSWGNITRDGLASLFSTPWPIVGAGAAITLVVLSFNLVGDAVRDALDPATDR